MSNHMIEWLDAEAMRKGNSISITAYGPDGEEKTVSVNAGYLRNELAMSAERFMEKYGDDSKFLLSLFKSLLTD
jgi:hypothetical protein